MLFFCIGYQSVFFFFQAEDGIRDRDVTGVQTCALPICNPAAAARVILAGRTAPIDLGTVERADGTHYFAVCGGTGFDAQLMAGTPAPEKHRWKMAAYVMQAFAALPH